jgi:hypothetical protein
MDSGDLPAFPLEAHMFLKPEVMTEFAERVGHRFADDYEPRLDIGVYESLLDLAGRTAAEIADLKPRDRIGVQSFIWTVGRTSRPPRALKKGSWLDPSGYDAVSTEQRQNAAFRQRSVLTDFYPYWAQRGASSPTQRDATPCPDLAN